MSGKIFCNYEDFYKDYIVDRLPLDEIREKYNYKENSAVLKRAKLWGLYRDNVFKKSKKEILTEEYLKNEYTVLQKSASQIAHQCGYTTAGTIHELLRMYKIPQRNAKPKKLLTKEFLQEHYFDKGKSARDISSEFKIKTPYSVLQAIYRNGLVPRKTETVDYVIVANIDDVKDYEEIPKLYWKTVIKGAIERRINFDLTIEDAWDKFLKQDRRCVFTGELLEFDKQKYHNSGGTASVDRIDSSVGYHKDNIQWVHKVVNWMKCKLSDEEFIIWCIKISKYRGKTV